MPKSKQKADKSNEKVTITIDRSTAELLHNKKHYAETWDTTFLRLLKNSDAFERLNIDVKEAYNAKTGETKHD